MQIRSFNILKKMIGGKTVQIKFTYTEKTKKGSKKKSFAWKGMSALIPRMKSYLQEQIQNLYSEEIAE